eukprot:127875_1
MGTCITQSKYYHQLENVIDVTTISHLNTDPINEKLICGFIRLHIPYIPWCILHEPLLIIQHYSTGLKSTTKPTKLKFIDANEMHERLNSLDWDFIYFNKYRPDNFMVLKSMFNSDSVVNKQRILKQAQVLKLNLFEQHYSTDEKRWEHDTYNTIDQYDNSSSSDVSNRLIKTMRRYDDNIHSIDESTLLTVLNDFLYLSHHQNDDEQFESIYEQMGGCCEIAECDKFKRNYRSRTRQDTQIYSHCPSAVVQIMDKIHCFYRHVYDTGMKWTLHDINLLNNCELKQSEDDSITNSLILKAKEIMTKKQKHGKTIERIYTKRNQFQLDSVKCVTENNNKHYIAGNDFFYGYIDGNTSVYAKYWTLKEELTSNQLQPISVEQFNNEYDKATLYIQSNYFKQRFTRKQKD